MQSETCQRAPTAGQQHNDAALSDGVNRQSRRELPDDRGLFAHTRIAELFRRNTMAPKFLKLFAIPAGCGLLIAAASTAPTIAAAQNAQARQLPEVIVEAGPVNRAVVGRSRTTNAPVESVTVDYHVRYSDLDLVKHSDVMMLHQRVEMAARQACEDLDKLYPLERSRNQTRTCTDEAVRSANQQIEQAITSAQGRRGSH
jgi:UrcA family protein